MFHTHYSGQPIVDAQLMVVTLFGSSFGFSVLDDDKHLALAGVKPYAM